MLVRMYWKPESNCTLLFELGYKILVMMQNTYVAPYVLTQDKAESFYAFIARKPDQDWQYNIVFYLACLCSVILYKGLLLFVALQEGEVCYVILHSWLGYDKTNSTETVIQILLFCRVIPVKLVRLAFNRAVYSCIK